jgi:hypothetical protein
LPVRAGIDPYRERIDHRGNDNVAGVEAARADSIRR